MRSIPQALFWEMCRRGRWQAPLYFLLGNALPVLIYSALSHHSVDQSDAAFVTMHVLFLPLILFMFAIGIVAAQGSLSRLYLSPISSACLVAWHIFPGAILLLSEVALVSWAQNAYFGLDFPIMGPSLFAATAWAAAQVLVCGSHRSVTGFALAASPCMLLFFWLQSRYGAWFQQPTHYWTEVTSVELLTMLSAIALSFVLTLVVVARDRCGEQTSSLKLWRWLALTWDRISSKASRNQQPFSTTMEAQLWSEWRSKGCALPIIVSGMIVVIGIVVLFRFAVLSQRVHHLTDLHEALLVCGVLYPLLAALCGGLLGSTSSGSGIRHHNATIRDLGDQPMFDQMGHFQATLPISNRSFADAMLRTAAKSILLSGSLWAFAFGAVLTLAAINDALPEHILPSPIERWFLPMILLGAWIGITLIATIVMTGRIAFFFGGLVVIVFGGSLLATISEQFVPAEVQHQLAQLLIIAVSLGIIVTTSLALVLANRHGMQSGAGVFKSISAWLFLSLLAVILRPESLPPAAYLSMIAFAALVVFPCSAAPLAIAWNRHR